MKNKFRWLLFILLVLFIILIPFILFNDLIEIWTRNILNSTSSNLIIASAVFGLLSIDILAPIPSSIVSTAGGYFLGFIFGTIVSLIGMTVSCIVGYYLGAKIGTPISKKLVGEEELSRFEKLQKRYGEWIIIISRAVPIFAEASILTAGIGRMPVKKFMILILLSNLGISIVYSAIGAYSANVNSFLLAFAGAIILPAIGMAVLKMNRLVKSR